MLTFGPQVEAAYGTTTFVVLYFLTGAFGNLMSFGQTQDPTIGGTVCALTFLVSCNLTIRLIQCCTILGLIALSLIPVTCCSAREEACQTRKRVGKCLESEETMLNS